MSNKFRGLAIAMTIAIGLGAVTAAPASASAAYSSKQYFSGSSGAYLWSYAYITSEADKSGCGDYNSWSKIGSPVAKKTKSIKTIASFTEVGLGSLSVSSNVSGEIKGTNVQLVWTNTNGATGSYISGGICMSKLSIRVNMQSLGSALYNGTPKTSQTPWI